jgi:hypothetical protein
MFIKKIKRICSVKGCKNTHNVFIISKRREVGGSVVICTDCLKEALKDTESYAEPAKVSKPIRPLFPRPELKNEVITSTSGDLTEEVETIASAKQNEDDVSNKTMTSAEGVITSAEGKKPKKNRVIK